MGKIAKVQREKVSKSTSATPIAIRDAQLAVLDFLKNFSCQTFSSRYTVSRVEEFARCRNMNADHWVASVMLPMSKVSVTFRVHFTSVQSRRLLSMQSDATPSSIKPKSAQDSLKEYCNVVMGKLKSVLRSEFVGDESRKVFVPFVDPSFDKYGLVPSGDEKLVEETWWRIVWDGGEIIAYGKAIAKQAFCEETFEGLAKESSIVSIDDEGDVDFFDF